MEVIAEFARHNRLNEIEAFTIYYGAKHFLENNLPGKLFLNSNRYKYDSILECCEIVEKYNSNTLWGYSTARMISAIHSAAYKYAVVMRKKGLDYVTINSIFRSMDKEVKQRYTSESLSSILERTIKK